MHHHSFGWAGAAKHKCVDLNHIVSMCIVLYWQYDLHQLHVSADQWLTVMTNCHDIEHCDTRCAGIVVTSLTEPLLEHSNSDCIP